MKNFQKQIEKIACRHGVTEVFDDFLTMAVCALSVGKMEKEYGEACRRYNEEEKKLFGHALGALITDYEACSDAAGAWDDILGSYFETVNSASQASRAGQFFTPKHLCDLMAQLTAVDNPGENINDPACGSGRNLIAHARLNANNRFNCFYTGNDLDGRCVKMCVLNMVMFGMKGVVIHMNTLSLQIYGGYRIYLPETGLGIKPLSVAQCMQYVYGPSTETKKVKANEQIKMEL